VADDRPAVGLHADALEVDGCQCLLQTRVRVEPSCERLTGRVAAPRAEGDAREADEPAAARGETPAPRHDRLGRRELERVGAAEDAALGRDAHDERAFAVRRVEPHGEGPGLLPAAVAEPLEDLHVARERLAGRRPGSTPHRGP